MMKNLKATVIAAAIAGLPLTADAAGLGRISVLSALGQPLRAEVELSASRDELSSLTAKVASPEAFKQAGIDYTPALTGIKFKVDRRANGTAVLKVSSDRPINDPFVDMLVEVNWASGRLVREYTFLLDPSEAVKPQQAEPAPVAAPTTAPAKKTRTRAAAAPSSAPAAPSAAPGEGYQVKRGDTLSKIAAQTAPEGVSVEQMLVALYNANKGAFDGNMNRLKAGRILTVPDKDTAASVSTGEAKQVVRAQAADFNAYRHKLADVAKAAPAAPADTAQQSSGGKITAKVEDKAPAATPGQDRVKVSPTEGAKDDPKSKARIAQLEEEKAAKERALKDANSRVADLEKNIKDLQKLAELKSQNLAELQKQAGKPGDKPVEAAKPVEPPKPAEPPKAAEPAKPAEPPKAETKPAEPPKTDTPVIAKAGEPKEGEPKATEPKAGEPTQAAATPAEPPKPAEPAQPAEAAKPAEPPKPVEPPKAEAKPEEAAKPAAEGESSFLSGLLDNPATLAGAGGLLALLVGWGVYRARSRNQDPEPSMPAPSIAPSTHTGSSVFGTTGGQSVDTSSQIQTDFSQSAMTAIDADEGVDPVAEADVYMAYGRDAQAEEILLDALKNEPTRHAIHVKLLEIYAQRKNTKQFENLATQLFGLTNGAGSDWEKAAAMGLKLDPSNPLYGGQKLAATSSAEPVPAPPPTIPLGEKAPEAPTALMSSSQNMKDTWTIPGELSQISRAVDNPDNQTTVILPEANAEAAAAPVEKLDFDLDLGGGTEPESAPMEFNLGENTEPDPDKAPTVVAAAEAEPVIDLTATQPNDVKALDFDLDSIMSDSRGASPAPATAEPVIDLEKTDVAGSLADFDFELGDTKPTAEEAPPKLNLSDISLELPASQPAANADISEDSFTGVEETNTKLELARAYEEMGDRDGARELLSEVLREGTSEQQTKARDLLAKIA